MTKAAHFNPPPADAPGKPKIADWVPPPATKETHNFAKLTSIDLSLLDSDDPAVVQDLIEQVKRAIREDGFLFLENYGVSLEQLHRQFSIANHLHTHLSDEDKERLLFHPDTGLWAGYKHPYGFSRERKAWDGIEQFNWYKKQWENWDLVPKCVLPFMDEIEAFSTYLSYSVNKRLLTLFSRVLELPYDDWLFDNVQSKGSPSGEGYFRHAIFRPVDEGTDKSSRGVRMQGHTDYGTTTLLFSVPISCLQIYGKDEEWHYVPYQPGALVINIGELLEILSGGHFKATLHKVNRPPQDQMTFERLSIVQFNSGIGDLRLQPIKESKLIEREGTLDYQGVYHEFKRLVDAGLPIPTNGQWREIQIANTVDPTDTVRNKVGNDFEIINGKVYQVREFHGVRTILPV